MDLQRKNEMREEGKVLLRRLLSGQYGVTQAMDGNGTQGAWRVVSLIGHLSQELRARGKHLEFRVSSGVIDDEGRSPEYAEEVKLEQEDGINDHVPADPLPKVNTPGMRMVGFKYPDEPEYHEEPIPGGQTNG